MKEGYILKTVSKNMTSYGDFKWKKKGEVICPNWKANKECGNGLHGALNGQGDGSLFSWDKGAIWIVAKVDISEGINLDGKWKFPKATVVYAGTQKKATDMIAKLCGDVGIIGKIMTGGYCSKMTGGDCSKMTGGDCSKITGGDYSKITGGYYSKITGGYCSKITGGYYSKITGGDYSKITGGDSSKMTGGDSSKMTGGDYSRMTSGYYSKMTGGNSSRVSSGVNSTLDIGKFSGAIISGSKAKIKCEKETVLLLYWVKGDKLNHFVFLGSDYPKKVGKWVNIDSGRLCW